MCFDSLMGGYYRGRRRYMLRPWQRLFGGAAAVAFVCGLSYSALGGGTPPACTGDNDGDGYANPVCTDACDGCVGPEVDCDDSDASVHPGATEVCGDGKDNDCDGLIDAADPDLVLVPDSNIPVQGFETRGECQGTGDPCDLRFPEAFPAGCTCVGNTNNFSQVIQACVDGGTITGPCDDGDPNQPGSLSEGKDCPNGGTCVPVPVRLGEPCTQGVGVCQQLGTVSCSGGQVICDTPAPTGFVAVEGAGPSPQTDPLCFDGLDNDCDGLVDREDAECQTVEFCDGFDNDNDGLIDEDFTNLGEDCTVGLVGSPCENTGVLVCKGGAVGCSLNPIPPAEISEVSCDDGIDNDCDGLIDCLDPDCTRPEVCDGKDNDCDNVVDNGFPELGQPCTVGVGACSASGVLVCNADGTGTICSATPLKASLEARSAGNSCTDGIDNDCNGVTDSQEPACQVPGLRVTCALESVCHDCIGWYRITYKVEGAVGESQVDANLLALDADGNVLATLPVHNGDGAKLGALKSTEDPNCVVAETIGGVHRVLAPIPLLRVVARDDQGTAEAYCSNTPFLDVREPNGSVVSGSAGNETNFLAAIPGVDPTTLKVMIDCVDIIPQLVANPAAQLPGGPFSGTVNINGSPMEIRDLIVRTDLSDSADTASSNTVTMTIADAGCGGHTLVVDGDRAPGALDEPIPEWCHLDELHDNGNWSVFRIDVTSPVEGQIVDDGGKRPASVNVTGDVCHGLEIDEVLINGHVATLPAPTIQTLGPQECAADSQKVTVSYDEDVPVTDVAAVFAGTQSTRGSFDPGPNKLIAQATDVVGSTTHDLVPFVVGPSITSPGGAVSAGLGSVAAGISVPKAFTIVLDDTVTLPSGNRALREFFDRMINEFSLNIANCLLQPREICCSKKLSMPWWTCDPNVTFCTSPEIVQTPEEFADTFNITITPHEGLVTLRVEIPEFRLNASANGDCCTGGCGFFCVARTKVSYNGGLLIPDIAFEIDIDESDILQQDGKFTLRFFPGDDQNIAILGDPANAIKTGCGVFSVGTLIDIFTLGIAAIPRALFNSVAKILGFIAGQKGIDLCPFVKEIGGNDGMNNESDDLTLDRDDLGDKFMMALEHSIDAVEITPSGIAIAIGATIEPTMVDPQSDPITGTLSTEAPLVQPGLPETQNLRSISVAIADDFWNQLLAGLVQSGKLRANFTKVIPLGSYLPSDCQSILDEGGAFADRRYARCIGMTECNNLSDFDALDRCQACLDTFPFGTCGGDPGGTACTLNSDCPGTCDGVCSGGLQDGQSCVANIGCGILGTCVKTCTGGPTPGATCSVNSDCREDCVTCLADDDASCVRGACIRAARNARDRNLNANTDIVLHARAENPPAFYLDDDPNTDLVEVIFRMGEMRSALIANRDGNNDVGGFSLGDGQCDENTPCDPDNVCDQGDLDKLDLDTIPDCSLDSLASNVDCLLWSTCLDLDVKFAVGVENVDVDGQMRPQLRFELIGIEEPPPTGSVADQGDQCGGAFEIPDLDFLNTEAARNDARKGVERSLCESTPPFQAEAVDFGGLVEFLNPALITVSNCTDDAVCDTDFADYLVITGDLKSKGLGGLIADKVCAQITAKITENTGSCDSSASGGDSDREKICP